MVTEWGMSESLGPLAYGKRREQIFLGRQIAQHRDYSEATAVEIDREVNEDRHGLSRRGPSDPRGAADALTRVAEALLEHEVLDAEQIAALVRGEPLEPFQLSHGRQHVVERHRGESRGVIGHRVGDDELPAVQ